MSDTLNTYLASVNGFDARSSQKTSQITDILEVSIHYIFSREGRGTPEAEVNDAR